MFLLPVFGFWGCGEEKLAKVTDPTTQPTASQTVSPTEPATPAVSPAPAATPPTKTTEPAQPNGKENKPEKRPRSLKPLVNLGSPLESGWVTILSRTESGDHGWIEGEIQAGEKLTINTENTNRFRLDLTRLHLDWEKGIVLRLDGSNSELTRKRWPAMVFGRTPSGGWVVEDD